MEDLRKFIKKFIEESKKENIINNLQEINKRFLTEYQIQITFNNKDLTIIPIETEIYYYNEKQKDIFEDKMIHKNDLQKNNFGKFYFHRIRNKNMEWGEKKGDPIDLKSCGFDVCLSDNTDYYLSILIRSAFINTIGEKFLSSGINNICKEIIKFYNPQDCLQCFF